MNCCTPKPMTAFQYIAGKISSGFLIMTAALVIMNIVFIILCYATAVKSGFAMNILDFSSEFDPVCP